MTTIAKFTTPSAAGTEVHAGGERYMVEHSCDYREAFSAVLKADTQLAGAYA